MRSTARHQTDRARVRGTFILLNDDPKHPGSDTGNLDMPKSKNKLKKNVNYFLEVKRICVHRESTVYLGFSTTCGFRHPLGGLIPVLMGKGGLLSLPK